MKKKIVVLSGIVLIGCNGGGGGSSSTLPTITYNPPTLNGAMEVSISNPTTCSGGNYNTPCVSVTICNPNSEHNSNNCSTVDNILLDTGSFGLRVFKEFVRNLNLPNVSPSKQVAECINYGDGSSNWGPVVSADVQLAADATAEAIPIQLIDSSFSGSSSCSNAATSPSDFNNLNGVLGVGPIVYDNFGNYVSCSSGNCSFTSIPQNEQIINPIAALKNSSYNDGLSLALPAISASGTSGVTTTLNFGIRNVTSQNVGAVYPSTVNSQTSSVPIGMVVYYNDANLTGFLDSGSNTYAFVSSINTDSNNYYIPSSQLSLTTQMQSSGAKIANTVMIGNAENLFSNNNLSFNNIGVNLSQLAGYFDYGLPFFYGKTVYVGFTGKTSSLGTGPYWAF